jgi:hypothetical protein
MVNSTITGEKLHKKKFDLMERKIAYTLLIRKSFFQVNLIFIKINKDEIYWIIALDGIFP